MDTLDFIKGLNFALWKKKKKKTCYKENEKQGIDWEKSPESHRGAKDLDPEYLKQELENLRNSQTGCLRKTWAKDEDNVLAKEDIQRASEPMKRCSISLIVTERQI